MSCMGGIWRGHHEKRVYCGKGGTRFFWGAFSWAACNFCMMLVTLELIYPIWYNVCRIIINYTRKGVVVDNESPLITIEDNVWLGDCVLIVGNVVIGEGSICAAGAVVTKDIPKCAIVGGNPARIIKYRDIKHYYNLKAKGKFS